MSKEATGVHAEDLGTPEAYAIFDANGKVLLETLAGTHARAWSQAISHCYPYGSISAGFGAPPPEQEIVLANYFQLVANGYTLREVTVTPISRV